MNGNIYKEIVNGWKYSHPLVFAGHTQAIMLVSAILLVLIGWLDFITGYEFGFFIFYFIPVAISAWYGGKAEGIIVAAASAVCWYISDKYTHHPYSHAYFIYWEMFMRLISFLTTALTLSRIRSLVINEERLVQELLFTRKELEHYRQAGNGE